MIKLWLLAIARVAIGQVLSLLMSLTGVSTTMLVNNNASYPILQSLTTYAAIASIYLPCYLLIRYKYNREQGFSNFRFMNKWWKYIGLGLIDLEANYCVVLAYKYTNIMSVQLFNCLTVPCVMVLSFFILKMRFAISHVFGSLLALGGLVLLIILDADGLSRSDKGQKPVVGDMLCVISSVLYATSNVLTEWFIKPVSPVVTEIWARESVTCVDDHQQHCPVCTECDKIAEPAEVEPEFVEERRNITHTFHSQNKIDNSELSSPNVKASNRTEGNSECVVETERENREYETEIAASNNHSNNSNSCHSAPCLIPAIENLCCMSCSALCFSIIQFFAIEWKTFAPHRSEWDKRDWLFQIVFTLTMLCIYTLMPVLFLLTSAAFTNVSLLTANIFAIIWNVTIFYIYPTKLFFVSFVLTACGIIIYDISDVIRIPFLSRFNYLCE